MKRKKNKSPQQLYQAARGNLLLMLIFSAVNVAFAAFGVDIYFLFSDYLAYMLALTGAFSSSTPTRGSISPWDSPLRCSCWCRICCAGSSRRSGAAG